MATAQKLTKTANKAVKSTKTASKVSQPRISLKVVKAGLNELPEGVHYVTSQNLLRKTVPEGIRPPFFMSEEDYRWLNFMGLQCGVTWCEVLRGLIAQGQAATNLAPALSHFIPALAAL